MKRSLLLLPSSFFLLPLASGLKPRAPNISPFSFRLSPFALRLAAVVLVIAGLSVAPAVADDLLREISSLARGGTPHLAIRLMDQHQPSVQSNPQAWMRWERERIYINELQRDWSAVLARLERLPKDLPREFATWAETKMAVAEIELGRSRQARERLARLIWAERPEMRGEHLSAWRRLIIRSYLTGDRIADAQMAMLRYHLDYGDEGEEWRLLRARVLLRGGRPEDAAELLKGIDAPEAVALGLLARSRSGQIMPADLRKAAERLLKAEDLDSGVAYQLWGTLAESAKRENRWQEWVLALEEAVMRAHQTLVGDSPVQPDADALWSGYETYAQQLANERQLLVGNFEAWFALADAIEKKQTVGARSLYGYLALNESDPSSRLEAHDRLVKLLVDRQALELVRELYLNSQHFPDMTAVPKLARYALAELAISEGDIALASSLMSGLDVAPEGSDAISWDLRRARVLILGGRQAEGIVVLRQLLHTQDNWSPELVDRINQVLFDLQTLGEHQVAYELFEAVLGRVDDPKLAREVIFWMAESLAAQGRSVEAARLYLKSAMLPGPHALDPWAQTARYRAAEALAEAGLRDDARVLYDGLLAATTEPDRKAALRRAIQQLWLMPEAEPAKMETNSTPEPPR